MPADPPRAEDDAAGGDSSARPALSRSAFAYRAYLLFWLGRLFISFAVQIVAVAVGWEVYDLTRDPFHLGLIGLVQFLPAALLVLVTGAVADRFRRRNIMVVCVAVEIGAAAALLAISIIGPTALWPIYAALVALGVARAFYGPAASALVPRLVPREALANAITWASSAWQVATIVGPVLGGLLYGLGAPVAYGTALGMLIAAGVSIFLLRVEGHVAPAPAVAERRWDTLAAGFRYVWREPVVLGAISLDLFAVLLGGATALLPAVARDVLEVGPWGLGMLRAAPGVGALLMAAYLSVRPISDHAGRVMFIGVAIFGLSTVVFGLSTTAWLSIAALFVMGASDMVSVTVRETLMQLWTPDAVRGRVNAVNSVFVGASNELGEFRAGMMATLIGVMPAIAFGGIGTIAVAALWSRWFPQLREARKLDAR
jgi:MFS family permease